MARTLADEGTTRVVFVPLAAIDDAGLVACAIAEALGLADISAADLPGRARSACGGRPMLLALDNFEQVLAAATLVADLLTSAPLLRLLVTSRTPLHVRSEREYVVDPLTMAPQADALSPDDLVRVRRGDAEGAIAIVRESLTRSRELHDKFAFVHAMVPLAAAAALKGDDTWAARVLGAADVVTERTGATVLDHSARDLREHTERDVRARLGPERWAEAYAAGRTASIDALLQDIDDHAADPLVE